MRFLLALLFLFPALGFAADIFRFHGDGWIQATWAATVPAPQEDELLPAYIQRLRAHLPEVLGCTSAEDIVAKLGSHVRITNRLRTTLFAKSDGMGPRGLLNAVKRAFEPEFVTASKGDKKPWKGEFVFKGPGWVKTDALEIVGEEPRDGDTLRSYLARIREKIPLLLEWKTFRELILVHGRGGKLARAIGEALFWRPREMGGGLEKAIEDVFAAELEATSDGRKKMFVFSGEGWISSAFEDEAPEPVDGDTLRSYLTKILPLVQRLAADGGTQSAIALRVGEVFRKKSWSRGSFRAAVVGLLQGCGAQMGAAQADEDDTNPSNPPITAIGRTDYRIRGPRLTV